MEKEEINIPQFEYRTKRREHCKRAMTLVAPAVFLLCVLFSTAHAQTVVDKMVATVDSGGSVDLITYSDLLWQLALQPDSSLENPTSAELNRVLTLVINQRLITQEADKVPTIAPNDREVDAALVKLINRFPSRAEFNKRLNRVGLNSEQLREIVRQRLAIDKYLDFRFRSFVVVTPEEIADYYKDSYVPRFRRESPGRIVPTLEEIRDELEGILTEGKIEADTDAFIEGARDRAEITILNPV